MTRQAAAIQPAQVAAAATVLLAGQAAAMARGCLAVATLWAAGQDLQQVGTRRQSRAAPAAAAVIVLAGGAHTAGKEASMHG